MLNDMLDFFGSLLYTILAMVIMVVIVIFYYGIVIFGLLYIGYLSLIEKVHTWKLWKKNN